MDPITMMLIGAGVGLLKDQLVDQPQYRRQKDLAAKTTALSPWTGLRGQLPKEPNTLGSVLQSGLTGATMGVGFQQNQANQKLADKMADYYMFGGPMGAGNTSAWGRARMMPAAGGPMSTPEYKGFIG